jgi:HD domain-containing protein
MERLAALIAAAVNMRTLYPANHPRCLKSVEDVTAGLQEILRETGAEDVTYVIIGDDLVVGDDVIRKTNLSVTEFIAILRRRGIERLTLADGLTAEELHPLVGSLAGGEAPQSSPHVVLGRAHILMEEEPKPPDQKRDLAEQVEIIRELWAKFRVDRTLPAGHLEELVWSLIDSLGRTTRSMLPLANLKQHDEYTFVHSINVSLLVLAQARAFGVSGPLLHAFGMAALLHDIGKLTIPLDILNKPGKLDDSEWKVMRSHPQQGALFLAEMEGTPPLAIVVAYEHHLRYDQRPNYPVLREERLPDLASRMTAIADTYDAMSTCRPYQEPLGRAAALVLLTKRSGSFYDPSLVANFKRLISESTA